MMTLLIFPRQHYWSIDRCVSANSHHNTLFAHFISPFHHLLNSIFRRVLMNNNVVQWVDFKFDSKFTIFDCITIQKFKKKIFITII